MRSRMPAPRPSSSSIYWNSVDSSASSSGSGSRNYVDPWDLENYAYLRRHSIAGVAPQPVYRAAGGGYGGYSSGLSQQSPDESDYWYAPSIREPGYDAPGSVEGIYFRPPRPVSGGCYYHQPIYEDESSHYAAPSTLYAHLSELEQAEALEEIRTREMLKLNEPRNKFERCRDYQRDECFYHRRPSEMMMMQTHARPHGMEDFVDEVETTRYRKSTRPSHITLNTYGHLKIDYTNSWNSLHQKII